MAARNSVKIYVENSFYHIYNRGVEQRNIFLDQQDYFVFLSYLKTYLSPKDEKTLRTIISSPTASPKEKDKVIKLLQLKNYAFDIELVCYALLPNHFHLLVRQRSNVLHRFMNSLGTRYGMYFNRRYNRKGVLFQDVYKAVLVETDEQLLHLSRYIHQNPTKWLNLSPDQWGKVPYPCSLQEYLGKRQTNWLAIHYVLDYFSKINQNFSYESFIKSSDDDNLIASLILED